MDEQTARQLAACLENSLSSDTATRRTAEQALSSAESQRGYPVFLLMLTQPPNSEVVNLAAAIGFKNFVKKHWRILPGNDDFVGEDIRQQIRATVITVMLSCTSDKIRKQLSEAIGQIGIRDFPARWPDLVTVLANHLKANGVSNLMGSKAVLQAANSLFARYKSEFQSEELIREILTVLNDFAQPLTDFAAILMSYIGSQYHPEAMSCLQLVAEIFYSLNCQDLPEFFEVNIQTWMGHFDQILKLQSHPQASDSGATLDEVKAAVCEAVALYAQKYSEEFGPFMPTFVTDIWQVLEASKAKAKSDQLASTAIQFLASIADRPAYASLFADPTALKSICENVVLPNLYFREEDEEDFEDNPEQFIRADLEGADNDTRRRSACELVKALNRQFEAQLVQHFSQYILLMLDKYRENRQANWKCKDVAIYLVTSIASKGSTQRQGTTKASELVNIQDFFMQHIAPELADSEISTLSVIKADCIKFVVTFRGQLLPDHLIAAIPCAINLLASRSAVVSSYACHLLERIFIMKGADGKQPLVLPAVMEQHANSLLTALCTGVLARPDMSESAYAMRCLLRSIWLLQEKSFPYLDGVFNRISERILSVARNPSKPEFNHYLFETVCVCCHVAYRKSPISGTSNLATLEKVLLPVFQTIVQGDVQEFLPYIFQVLTLLLDYNEPGRISDVYMAMLPFFMQPVYWERSGNVAALTLLMQAYIEKSPGQLSGDQINQLLGIFQKLLLSKAQDHDGMKILSALITHIPAETMAPNITQVFTLLLRRLSTTKTPKFVRLFLSFLSLFVRSKGPDALVDTLEGIQPGLFTMIVQRIIAIESPKQHSFASRLKVAICVAFLLSSPKFPDQMLVPFVDLALQLAEVRQAADEDSGAEDDAGAVAVEETAGYEAAFSQLAFATRRGGDINAEGQDKRLGGWESTSQLQTDARQAIAKAVVIQMVKISPRISELSAASKSALVAYGVPLI